MSIPTKEQLKDGSITIDEAMGESKVFSLIKAHQAKNNDGSPSGYLPGTEEGERECIEIKSISPFVPGGVYYQNIW